MSITEFWLKNIYRSHGIRHKDLEFPREIFRASFAPYMSPPFLSEIFSWSVGGYQCNFILTSDLKLRNNLYLFITISYFFFLNVDESKQYLIF